jgi:hypothetical protein
MTALQVYFRTVLTKNRKLFEMDYSESLKNVSVHIIDFYTKNNDARLLYHNHSHTWELSDAVNRIADRCSPDDRTRFIAGSAALFYNTGYLQEGTGGHKEKSADYAEQYLKSIGVDDLTAADVRKCILSTQLPLQPQNPGEAILCDAVMFYLGTKEFPEKNKLLRRETEILEGIKIAGNEWRKKSISLMESHQYFTDYCRLQLNEMKLENINRLKKKQEEQETPVIAKNALQTPLAGKEEPVNTPVVIPMNENVNTDPTKQKPGKKGKKERPSRGVETLFRISSTNNQRLSAMADNKAHIMISVNSIIISAVLALVIRNLDSVPYLLIPTVMLLFVSLTTIIFSILATRPKLPSGYFTKEQVAQKDIDLSFFGNYYKMDFKEYDYGMKEMMNDKDFLYGSLTRNLYSHAKVLGRKFRLLRISYDVFMYGLAIVVLVYVVQLLLNH